MNTKKDSEEAMAKFKLNAEQAKAVLKKYKEAAKQKFIEEKNSLN